MNPLERYILKLPKNEQEISYFFHSLLVNTYKLTPAIKWNIPTYSGSSLVCYLNPDKHSGIHLCFMQGFKLINNHRILDQKNRKLVASYHVLSLDQIAYNSVIEVIEEAISIDQFKKIN